MQPVFCAVPSMCASLSAARRGGFSWGPLRCVCIACWISIFPLDFMRKRKVFHEHVTSISAAYLRVGFVLPHDSQLLKMFRVKGSSRDSCDMSSAMGFWDCGSGDSILTILVGDAQPCLQQQQHIARAASCRGDGEWWAAGSGQRATALPCNPENHYRRLCCIFTRLCVKSLPILLLIVPRLV